jgi:Co/Zn/Cd efflux system component
MSTHHPRIKNSHEDFHGPELNTIVTPTGSIELSIFEDGIPPHFRLSGVLADSVTLETKRDTDSQVFIMQNMGEYWQSVESIPEPHEFSVSVTITRNGSTESYNTLFEEHSHAHGHGEHGHSHGLVDVSITRSKEGVKVVSWSLVVLVIASLLQVFVYLNTHSISLLADLIHNFGDALTAIPLGVAFLLRNRRAEKISGYFVVAVILISAIVVGIEAITRLAHPQPVTNLLALVIAGFIGFAGNEIAAIIRLRGGKHLNSPALTADGKHARVDGLVSLSVVVSAVLVALGFQIADPLIGLGMTVLILRITWQSYSAIRNNS